MRVPKRFHCVVLTITLVSTIACIRAPAAPNAHDDQRALCRAAFSSSMIYAATVPLQQPLILYSNGSCDAAIPDAEYAMVRAGLLARHVAEERTYKIGGTPFALTPEHVYESSGTRLAVWIDDDYVGGCRPQKCYSARTLEEEECDATSLPICEIDPSVCAPPLEPKRTVVHGPLDLDTSCSPRSEGRCVDIRITASDGLWSVGRTWVTATCHAGMWRIAGGWPIEVHTI
jgi:hypothetical protein